METENEIALLRGFLWGEDSLIVPLTIMFSMGDGKYVYLGITVFSPKTFIFATMTLNLTV